MSLDRGILAEIELYVCFRLDRSGSDGIVSLAVDSFLRTVAV
jgi:hypothetical protein